MRKLVYIQIILSYLCYAFIAIYYNVINKEHTGNMDWWGSAIIIIAILNIFLALYLLDKKTNKVASKSILEKILEYIVKLPIIILLIPLIILIFIFSLFTSISSSIFLVSRALRKKGFKYKSKTRPWIVFLTKNNIVIKFSYESYQISFDTGESYINIFDSDLGTIEERNILKDKVIEYIDANPLDKQRGDVVDPINDCIKFLNKHLD